MQDWPSLLKKRSKQRSVLAIRAVRSVSGRGPGQEAGVFGYFLFKKEPLLLQT
jgi:hypothetical protein